MKQNKNKQRWPRVQVALGVALTLAGVALLIAAFYVPPTGEIHSSVLVAYGETLTFAGALLGIDAHYKSKHTQSDKDNGDPPTF
ncbi:MAG: hypothetical protein NC301_07400 [Bacteroides sp.]|nr:hypothetical protein [Bacteroides sp.]MCM1380008.1 hypothetical protein [Bacteroides sp.]MCM1446312.1 hypothetical protein [Prevotella sp.]